MSIGFIGAGRIGGTLAKLAVGVGRHVILSNSRGPESLTEQVAQLGTNAKAATIQEAAAADLVVISVPFKAVLQLPANLLNNKIVIDTNNYFGGGSSANAELDAGTTSSSELIAKHFEGAKIVKAFNVINYKHLASQGKEKGNADRQAIPIAGDDAAGKKSVSEFIDAIGFDVVDVGPLAQSKRIQPPSSPVFNIYGGRVTSAEVGRLLGFTSGVH